MMRLRHWSAVSALVLLLGSAAARAADGPDATPRYTQSGLASYYGPGFQGELTASGEVFDERELVAAHRTLPFGSMVRVTNLENGRSVVVRVTDRGPFGRNSRKGCIIDVSRAAARRLRFLKDGIVRVSVQVLK
jgi:rare lipoprotein A